jgi:DNA-binding NarL/FixJ family response regulator
VIDPVERLSRFHDYRRRLSSPTTVEALLSDTAQLICEEFSFDRAVVLSVEPGQLTAQGSGTLANPASDRLRRQVLAAPITLRADSVEAELIRRGQPSQRARAVSQVAQALELRHYFLAPVTPERRTLAILVADRAESPVSELEGVLLTLLSDFLAAALERVVAQARQEQLATEFQHLTTSALALMREVTESPTSLPVRGSQWPAFPLTEQLSSQPTAGHRLTELLTPGEAQVASLLVKGRSNREIADAVILSPETVKATVARILRKLGASNRVEAAAIILRFSE